MYNKTKEYEEEILPLLTELKRRLVRDRIPFFFSCAPADDGVKTSYMNESYTPMTTGIEIANDHFKDYVLISAGFTAQPTYKPRAFMDDEIEMLNNENIEELYIEGTDEDE